MNNAASRMEVLPLEAWPTTATVRIFEVSIAMRKSPSTGSTHVGRRVESSQKVKTNQEICRASAPLADVPCGPSEPLGLQCLRRNDPDPLQRRTQPLCRQP